jgi:gluconolactonase
MPQSGPSAERSSDAHGAGPAAAPRASNAADTRSEAVAVGAPSSTTEDTPAPVNDGADISIDIDSDGVALPLMEGVCPPGPFADSPLPLIALPELVCSGMTFAEGPVWFADRNTLFFSDFQIINPLNNFNGRIMTHTPGGGCDVFIQSAGTNGLAIAPDGNLLACRHVNQTVSIFDLTTRAPSVLIADDDGASFNSPNDVTVRSDGNLYFTDNNLLRGLRLPELPPRAYRRDPSGALTVIDEGSEANGINLSPDETLLYVSRLGLRNDVAVFDVDASGAVGAARPFIPIPSDGMAVDCAGNVYITPETGVLIFDPSGNLIGTIPLPGASNLAFGGPERRTLFITATVALFSVELAIPGLPN